MSLSKIIDSKRHILEYLILALILILAAVISCYRIAEPAWDRAHVINYGGAVDGWHGSLLTEWAGVARNYLKFDYPETGLGQAAYVTQEDPTLFHHRVDYPPLFPLLVALSFRLFGVHEWSARLVPLLSSAGLLLLVFWLGRKLGGKRVALTASFFFALLPMQVYYSTLTDPQILGSFFSWLTFVFYLQWVEKGETRYYVGIYASFVLGALSAWVAYFVVPAILLHYLVCEYKGTRNLKFVLLFALTPLVLFGIHLGWTYMLGGEQALKGLLDRFLIRTVSGGTVEGQVVFTVWDLYSRGYVRARLFLTPIICFLSAVWFITLVVAILRQRSFFRNLSNREIFSRRD
ncbi:MAG TPA: glycosyltransferase family 39 protein, partial [Anaerolineae bacterium]|nr:glycosyltransferase family 39 protein [Anaerolineae bacterium]